MFIHLTTASAVLAAQAGATVPSDVREAAEVLHKVLHVLLERRHVTLRPAKADTPAAKCQPNTQITTKYL